MRYLFLVLLITLFFIDVKAQKKPGIIFSSYNSVGFIAGKLPVSFTAQTENGINYKNWFVGFGFGVDNYYLKTLPLFFAVKNIFPFKNNSGFLYVNAGTNFINKDKEIVNTFSIVETQGGFYGDAGIGYKIKITKRNNIFFNLGNTVKQIEQTEKSTDTGFPYSYTTKYKLSRIIFKIGYQF